MNQESRDIRKLIDLLNEYTEAYDKGTPIISDKDWDNMYFKLVQMEQKTGIIYPNSPTQSIHFETKSKLDKVIHDQPPMLSLDKTKDIDVVSSFVKGHDWFGMFKMDGLSARLVYKDGKLIQASTRGNGIEGEDITHNVLVMPNVPKTIPNYELTIIDGEIVCDLNTFNEKFKNDYANPRNFASGSIRQLSSKESASRSLSFVAWDLVQGCDDIDFNFWRLEKLDEWGFDTVPRVGDAETVDDAIDILDSILQDGHKNYPIDGYVFKFESKKYGESLGRTDHHFKNAIAYKFYDEEYETRLKYIDYDVSRNGILTPVAVFDPIDLDGSIVERASLHNISIMKEVLGITPYAGEKVWVIKSNMIIPQITRAEKKDYGDIIAAGGVTVGLGGDYGVLCPICGSLTSIKISESGVETLYCDNEECPGKLAQRIDHFCGKKGLDIKGISRKTIEKLIDWGWINGLADIFRLEQHKTEWISKEGFGEASVKRILSAIHESTSGSRLENYISALGIPLVGKTIAKEIIKYYSTWEEFRAAIGGDWTEFEGFGPEISKAINSFDYTEADEAAGILDFIQPEIQNEDTPTAALKDKKFCATGKLQNFTRDSLKADIEAHGGKLVSSVTSATDYLITNTPNSNTQKNKDAIRLGVKVITEEEYIKLTQ